MILRGHQETVLGEWGSTVHGQIILENPSLNWVKEFFLTTGLLRAITELVFMANALGGKKKKKTLNALTKGLQKTHDQICQWSGWMWCGVP